MTNTSSAIDENFKPICHGSPRPLLELASTKIALHIWLQKFNEFYKPGNLSRIPITKLEFKYEISTDVPVKIKKMVDDRMYPIARELDVWVVDMKCDVPNLPYDLIYTRFNLAVFINGTVHYRDTIANFLEDESLTNVTRFLIACVYCVEEKINFFWPLVKDTLSFINWPVEDYFMLYYWIFRKKGELGRIRLERFSSIENLMIYRCRQNTAFLNFDEDNFHVFRERCVVHPGVGYFFKLLNSDDQLSELNTMVTHKFGITYLLPYLDGPTQRRILDEHKWTILSDFVAKFRPVEYTVQCFLYIRNIITLECYCDRVIRNIISNRKSASKCSRHFEYLEKEEAYKHKHVEVALEQIWLNTPPHLKKYALENLSGILNDCAYYIHHRLLDFGRDIRFLLAVLSDANVQLRKSVWVTYWEDWIIGVPPCQFEELMGLCLRTTESVEEFKSTLPYTETFLTYCEFLINEGYCSVLDEFLNTLYSNPELVLNIKKHIFSTETHIFFNNPERVKKYAKYIDNSFSNHKLAADFKNDLIFSDSILKVLLHRAITHNFCETICNDFCEFTCDNFCRINFIVSLFVSPQKHTEIKRKFLESFREWVTGGDLRGIYGGVWKNFLKWCTENDEQRLDDFRKSFDIDVIFQAACSVFMNFEPEDTVFRELVDFLMWYFIQNDSYRNYVKNKVEYYEEMDAGQVGRIFGIEKEVVLGAMRKSLIGLYWYSESIPRLI